MGQSCIRWASVEEIVDIVIFWRIILCCWKWEEQSQVHSNDCSFVFNLFLQFLDAFFILGQVWNPKQSWNIFLKPVCWNIIDQNVERRGVIHQDISIIPESAHAEEGLASSSYHLIKELWSKWFVKSKIMHNFLWLTLDWPKSTNFDPNSSKYLSFFFSKIKGGPQLSTSY